ncbi:sodium:solute symporter family protein [Candidatus Sumerlaeota bacterium]|nr:sodium:solute symporter family protein [Candidatus Sumerlaeota bacterium]
MYGLHIADVIVLFVYLIGITIIGAWAAKLVKNMRDFFMPRRFGKTMLITHAFGTGTHADQAVGVASKTFTNGLSGIWYQWLWLFCTPFYWLIAPVMRRFRAITVSDVFNLRYDRSVGILFALVGAFQLTFNIGIMLKGSGAVIAACFGSQVSPDFIILGMTLLFMIYGIAGGLSAAIITDFFQGILTVVFSFALVPFVMRAVGGMEGLRQTITDPRMFSLVAPGDIGLFYIIVISLNALVGIVTQPHTMGNCAAGRTEYDGRFGWTVGNFVKRICTMAWCITGLAALAYLGKDIDPDHAYGIMARDFFPRILPGLLGVFLASLLASLMSSCDSFMIASSALFTENVYKPLMPAKSEKHYVFVGRIMTFMVVICGVICAYKIKNVVDGLEIFWKLAPMMGIAFWLGLFWRRATVAGAWAATLGAFGAWWLTTQPFFCSIVSTLPGKMTVEKAGVLSMSLPWQMVFYLSIGVLLGVIVSLFTKPVPEEKLERFYELVRTPVMKGEPAPETPCLIPEGIQVPPKRLIFNKFGLEILVPSRMSIIGFILSWILVFLMLAGFYAITR